MIENALTKHLFKKWLMWYPEDEEFQRLCYSHVNYAMLKCILREENATQIATMTIEKVVRRIHGCPQNRTEMQLFFHQSIYEPNTIRIGKGEHRQPNKTMKEIRHNMGDGLCLDHNKFIWLPFAKLTL